MEISERVSGSYNHPEGVAAALIGHCYIRPEATLEKIRQGFSVGTGERVAARFQSTLGTRLQRHGMSQP